MISNSVFDFFTNEQIGFMVNSAKAVSGDIRLDSSHFIDDSNIIISSDINFKQLNDFVEEIVEPKLFTRIYCENKFGVPYISSSEMSEIEPPINSRFISKELTNNISQYIIKRGQILVSAAGTVGSVVLATKDLDGVAGTSDILRINVDCNNNLGFVFTYLTSSFGANELANLAYGAIIKRVRGFQLEALKTPVIDYNAKNEMNHLIFNALDLRDEANELIKRARSLVLKYNNLPPIDKAETETLDPEKEIEIRLVSTSEFTIDVRLDAHFYNPLAKKAVENIDIFSINSQFLPDLTSDIIIGKRFKRNYVESDYGTPFLSGKNIIQIRPSDLKYLSDTEISFIDELLIKRNWTLITCSGTLGRTCFVYNNYENYAASQHILRIVPDENFIDPGYLYCFLSTEYGYNQIVRNRYGAVIDEVDDKSMENIKVPIPEKNQQNEIGDLVRHANDLRAEAIRLEDEAQEILTKALTNA